MINIKYNKSVATWFVVWKFSWFAGWMGSILLESFLISKWWRSNFGRGEVSSYLKEILGASNSSGCPRVESFKWRRVVPIFSWQSSSCLNRNVPGSSYFVFENWHSFVNVVLFWKIPMNFLMVYILMNFEIWVELRCSFRMCFCVEFLLRSWCWHEFVILCCKDTDGWMHHKCHWDKLVRLCVVK